MNVERAVEPSIHRMLDEVPGIMWTTDRQLRFTLSRGAGLGKLGLEQNQVVGMTLFDFFETSDEDFPAIAAHRQALSGQIAVYQQDWCGCQFQVTIKPRCSDEGEIIGCIGIAQDITARRHAEHERQRLEQFQEAINRILSIFTEPVTIEQQLDRCLDTLFALPWLSVQSCGAIFLADAETRTLNLRAQRGLPESLLASCRCVAFGHCLCGRVASVGQLIFADHLDDRHETTYEGIGDHGHYCIPLAAEDELVGVLNLYVEPGHCRQSQEEQFLSSVGAVIGGAIKYRRVADELREQQAQLIAAEEIQSFLLPKSAPQVAGFDIAGACYPAAFAAGDHYDFLRPAGDRLVLAVSDVSGHGVGPAILMAAFHAHLRSLVGVESDLEMLAKRLNAVTAQESSERHFITMLAGELDLRNRLLHYVRCGHPPAFVMDRHGHVTKWLESGQLPLGVLTDTAYQRQGPIVLQSGDLLALFTDGILETTSPAGVHFGNDGIVNVVRENRGKSATEIIRALRLAAEEFQAHAKFEDDVTLMIAKVL